jgi:putative protease
VEFPLRRVQELEQSFSRGFSPGWLQGCDHKMLVPATSSAKRGVLLGTVQRVDGPRVAVELQYVVRPGDGVVFDGDRMAGDEQGGRVFEIFRNGWRVEDEADRGCVELTFDSTAIDLHRLSPGQRIWKTDDPQLNRRLQQTFRTADPIRRVPLRLNVSAAVGQPLRVNGRTDTGRMCSAESSAPLAEARKHPLTEAVLREQFARLGGTVFELAELRAAIVGSPMAPLSVLGQVRRELLRQLATSVFVEPELAAVGATDRLRAALKAGNPQPPAGAPELVVMCRTLSQLESLAATRGPGAADELIADFQDPREHRAAIDAAQRAGRRLLIATPRIQKPGEIGLFRTLLKLGPEAVLIRNLAGLAFFRDAGVAVAGDYSLNVTNELTAGDLMQRGLQWLTPSYDLNREQLFDLVQAVPPAWLEVVMHQHMPMFHMEHCVFCAMLSPGTNKTNCGRPCDVHQVELRDRTGVDHPLVADVGCRNTLFNSVAQSSAEVVSGLLAAGVRRFRIELLRETPDEAARLVGTYRSLLTGGISGTAVWQQLNAMNRVGVTRGTLEPRRNPLAIL